MSKQPTAKQARLLRANTTRRLLAQLSKALDAHEQKADGQPDNWGFAGNLGYVNAEIAGVLAFLQSAR